MTFLDDEFKYFLTNMSCFNVLRLPYEKRCMMVKRVKDCKEIINSFNYFEMMYCFIHIHEKITEICVMCLFFLLAISYVILMYVVVSTYCSITPNLKIIAMKLHMNENLAGATLLAFASSCPDLVRYLMVVHYGDSVVTAAVGDALINVLLCGGMICFMRPFQMEGFTTMRDLLFLWLGIELLRLLIFHKGSVSIIDSLVLLSFYLIYLIIIVLDLKLLRNTVKKLSKEITELQLQEETRERNIQLGQKLKKLRSVTHHEIVNIRSSWLEMPDSMRRKVLNEQMMHTHQESVDYEANRVILHNEDNSKNKLLWTDLLDALNPIDAFEWQLSSCPRRAFMVIKCPMAFLVSIFVPLVDYEKHKHGWSKLLNCTQIISNPFLLITAIHSKFGNSYSSWYIDVNLDYAKWSLLPTVPLAIIVFCNSRTDVPPNYHMLFVALSASSSLAIIVFCTGEIEVLFSIVGIVINLTAHFMNITFGSVGSAIIKLIASYDMAMQGYEKMVFTAIFAGPLFNVVVSMGIAFLFSHKVGEPDSVVWLNDEHGDICYIFMVLTLSTTIFWCLTFNFMVRRSAAIHSWVLFFTFLLYMMLTEWDVVHEISRDETFEPI